MLAITNYHKGESDLTQKHLSRRFIKKIRLRLNEAKKYIEKTKSKINAVQKTANALLQTIINHLSNSLKSKLIYCVTRNSKYSLKIDIKKKPRVIERCLTDLFWIIGCTYFSFIQKIINYIYKTHDLLLSIIIHTKKWFTTSIFNKELLYKLL